LDEIWNDHSSLTSSSSAASSSPSLSTLIGSVTISSMLTTGQRAVPNSEGCGPFTDPSRQRTNQGERALRRRRHREHAPSPPRASSLARPLARPAPLARALQARAASLCRPSPPVRPSSLGCGPRSSCGAVGSRPRSLGRVGRRRMSLRPKASGAPACLHSAAGPLIARSRPRRTKP
jgi:hypothetical protein